MSWISISDLIAAVMFLLESPSLHGAVNLVAPHPVTNSEFTRTLARLLHRLAVLPAPAFALRLALGPMADEALLSSTRVRPSMLINAGFGFTQPTIEAALNSALRPRV
jgi:hypothetical protein